MKSPNFFIIGAPKCGTTSLAAWLSEHSQIFMSKPKEINHFDTDMNLAITETIEDYLLLFKKANDRHIAIGEASTGYLFSQVAVKNIFEFDPSAKFIVMLRNPLEMLLSLHNQMYQNNYECIKDFETAWRMRNMRKLEKGNVGRLCPNLCFVQYEKMCKLGEQVDRLLKTIKAESTLFILMEDLKLNPSNEYCRVLDFLNVEHDGKYNFAVFNSKHIDRNRWARNIRLYFHIIRKKLRIQPFSFPYLLKFFVTNYEHQYRQLSSELRQELIDEYRDDVILLSSLIDRDLSHWLR